MEKNLNMGSNSSRVFAGESFSPTNHLLYTESPLLFAEIIKNNFSEDNSYSLIDLGSASGELVENIFKLLPGYKFNITAVDVSESSLLKNKVAQTKIVADLTELPCKDKEFDLSIMRYVLQWNSFEDQEKIIKEVSRITKGLAVIQHGGADHENREKWREASNRMFTHPDLSKLNRDFCFFSSQEEVETILKTNGMNYKRIQSRRTNNFSDVFVERFNLNNEEENLVKDILDNYNYIMQSAWILDFRN